MHDIILSETFSLLMYFVPPIVSLIFFYYVNKKLILFSILITILVDVVFWFSALFDFNYGLPLLLIFIIPQIIIVSIIASFIYLKHIKTHNI